MTVFGSVLAAKLHNSIYVVEMKSDSKFDADRQKEVTSILFPSPALNENKGKIMEQHNAQSQVLFAAN